ncbi:LOW QUALITY PROTEIN: apoptotic chromatin condensation inducer 1b [Cottoperca gobio]|uniref:LOW QUALITY PROTEIN: apoptotic chromatin condensation inducer 1b n=1 Tax=Cottoperca gobio TaxID=56716 RepID=A0A6J2RNC3_COTGO|nr:LOW QUALITY PROTEIN: apoptotic chromatin condensation inducer in the nucleus-like [Cottoperca gobio]
MADEDITLDGKPLQSLRVADLKAALEQRNLPKSGQKNTLIKRLKGALMLENLQKSSSSHSGLQPNSQIGEEMSQNSFIKQYLAKQQELLHQRLEREAQQEEEADESPAVQEEDDDQSEDNDSSSYVSDKMHHSMPPKPSMTRAEAKGGGDLVMVHGMMACGPDMGPGPPLHPQESLEAPGARMQRATFHQGHKEPPAPSPPRAVASLSVRVLGQPDRQGLPPAVARAQEKEGTAPSEPGSAHPVLHLSRSAGVSTGGQVHEDSDDDDDGDDESEDDEDWGPGPGGARRGNRVPPQQQQMPPSVPSTVARSKRKLQPPQHIPPPQVHHTPMQLRHPTPPPSPPPDLFPLPDTPKQSPPDTDDQEGEGPEASRGPRVPPFPPSTMQRQDSDSSSRSSSPEPSMKRRPGPLSLLVHRMESEGAFRAAEATSAVDMSGETAHSAAGFAGSSESPLKRLERKRLQENREMEEERRLKEEKEREQHQKQERERKKIQEQEREKKRLEEEKEKERKQLEEEEKQQREKEEREKERKRQEEEKERKRQEEEKEKERKRQDEEKRREEKLLKEKEKRQETAYKGKVAVTEAQDSGSSSDSDSKSDSSSHSSQSSSSSGDKIGPATQLKKADQGQEAEDEKKTKGAEKQYLPKREVSEPSAAAVTEVEPDSESSMAQQPPSGAEPENSEGRLEESTTPKAFAARKISLTSSKTSPAATDGAAGEAETGTAAGRKRRWGSSTAVTSKKPSISITTDSLKSLIPDIKVNQEAVVELHPEELQMSGDEESPDASRGDQDKGLKIRRTVTQVVPSDTQENGQTNEEEEVEKTEKEKQRRTSRDKRNNSVSEEASETQTSAKLEGEAKKVTPSDSLVRRSISQQKSGVSVTIDDPVRAARQPSPPHGKLSNIIHVTNLVRPFTLGQLKELLNRTGSVVEEGFWIDKIKSHCFVTYATAEEAVATRAGLHGVKWPPSNPKVLSVDFCEQDELDVHKGILKPEKEKVHAAPPSGPQNRLLPLMPERDRDREREREREPEPDQEWDRGMGGVRDLWAERQREMERRERARGEREWDRDKVREFARPGDDGQRSRSRDRERRRRERAKSKERKTDKKEKGDEPPVKLLDDLFLKTKAAPCIYWLPLSEEQAAQRLLERTERQKERERRRKERQEEEEKKREEEKKERLKGREKEGSAVASGGAAGRGADRDRERERGRDREADKKRDDSHRPRRPSVGAGSGRRSRSRSNPRDRRR